MGIPIPYTVIVFCEGLGFAALQLYLYPNLQESFETPEIGADLIVYVFLPILLFGEVKNLNWHRVKSVISQSMILAGPGAFISCILTSLFIKILLPNWSWSISLLFGAVLCATDPVSVVSLLKTSGASNRLTILIVGESLMNDGVAMILFFFFFNYIESPDKPYTPFTMFLFILRMIVVSPAFGCTIGLISNWIMKKAYQDYLVRDMNFYISVTLITAYVSFVFAQSETYLSCSGVLSCCGSGLMLSWLGSPKILRDHKMDELWESLEWACNTLIFLLAGVIAGIIAGPVISWTGIGYLFAIYAALNGIRLLLVFILFPVLVRVDNGNGLKITMKDAFFITWGGVRGALGISLALIVLTCLGGTGSCPVYEDENIGKEFFLYVAGVAGLTLLVNGTFAAPVLQWLGLVGKIFFNII
jgi:NhaP-type Na+/H+ or K+/H+ antiporter